MEDGNARERARYVESLGAIAADPGHPLRAYVRRLTRGNAVEAEDVLQEALLRALARTSGARAGQGLERWLRGIAFHVWKDAQRRSGRPLPAPPEAADDHDPFAAAERRDAQARLRRALCELTPRERQVLWLHGEGRAISEIAAARAEHPEKTKSILRRSREALLRRLRRARPD